MGDEAGWRLPAMRYAPPLFQIKAGCLIAGQDGPQRQSDDRGRCAMEITSDKVAEVIILARELDRAVREFDAFVERLSEEEQAELVAIFWIGRGSFEPEDWAEAVATATHEATVPTAEYLKGSPHLADHLEAGLDALGIDAGSEEDELYRGG